MSKALSVTENIYVEDVNKRRWSIKKWVMKMGGPTTIIINLLQSLVVAIITISLILLIAMSLLRFILYQ